MTDFDEQAKAIARKTAFELDVVTPQGAYAAGYDAVVNGPNEKNCHCRWFSSWELRDRWDAGKREAEERTK